MRWRLRLSELDFTTQYRPGIVHQVPDALSRIISPQGKDDRPVDDEVPTYGDHENVLVTTRSRKRAANVTKTASERTPRTNDSGNVRKRDEKRHRCRRQTKNAYEDDEQRLIREFDENVHGNDAGNEDEALDEVLDEDLDIFDLAMAYRDDGRNVRIADVPVKSTRNEVLDAQRYDDFCQTILARQDRHRDSAFFEDDYGILRRLHPSINGLERDDDTQRSTASNKSSYPKRYDHVYSILRTTRNSQATRVRLVCIVTYAQRITGLKWQPMSIRPYERLTHALRTVLSYENESTRYDYSPHVVQSKRYRSIYSACLRKRRKDIDSYL